MRKKSRLRQNPTNYRVSQRKFGPTITCIYRGIQVVKSQSQSIELILLFNLQFFNAIHGQISANQ